MQKEMEPCYLPLLIRGIRKPIQIYDGWKSLALERAYLKLARRGVLDDFQSNYMFFQSLSIQMGQVHVYRDNEHRNERYRLRAFDIHLLTTPDLVSNYYLPRERVMDQQIWPFFWALAALFLAVAFHFIWKKSSRVSNGASPSSSQSESPAENKPSAASSSSNSALPVEFEVFLSFRGPDVRTNFADVLYKFLDRFKIQTFLDNEELRKGETIAPSLEKAIKKSKVYIPILSQDYASSKWCLKELAQMVKCCKQGDDRIILPIFYMMEPRDVRHQEGSYKKAFQLYSKKYDAETIKEWKEALKEVGEMKGWSVKESDRSVIFH